MWFDGWHSIGRTVIAGIVAYVVVIIVLRISGKRTLAKMNAFDLIVTVALGSTLSTVLVSENVSIASGVLALALLVVLQYTVASAMIRSKRFQRLVKSRPARLFSAGEFDEEKMMEERILREEIVAAMRSSGFGDPSQVAEVWLETDGSFSVIARR